VGDQTDTRGAEKKSGLARILIVVVGVVVVAVALYAFGAQKGRAQLETQRVDFEERLASAGRALTSAEQRLAVLRNVKALQQAEIALFESAVELDRRNFGTANEHIRKAGTLLARIEDPAGGLSLEQIALLGEDIGLLDINVAVNLEDQRARVLGLAARLRDLIPEVSDEAPVAAKETVESPAPAAE
jgi:hypothetical protein